MKPIRVARAWIVGLLLVGSQVCQATETKPNVVLIISDDQAWTDYGFMGHPLIRTPQIDRLASESLTFPRGYVPTSLCSPSLATIISGLYPHQHQVTGNDPPAIEGMPRREMLRDPEYRRRREQLIAHFDTMPSLPRILASQGYQSLQTGKWWGGSARRGGFTSGMTHGDPDRGGRHGDEGLSIGRMGLEPIRTFLDQVEKAQQPFLIWYAPFLPHTPHTPPKRLLEEYRKKAPSESIAKYWAMCTWFDETVGGLLTELADRGLEEDTIVIYVCDNGWIQDPNATRYAPRSKRSPYDGGLRTPILVRWKGRVDPNVVETPVSSIDLAPTILDTIGLDRDPKMLGVNLLDAEQVAQRESIFGAIYTHDAIDLDDPSANLRYRWIIQGERKLIDPAPWNEPSQTQELYEISRDPFENVDLAQEKPQAVVRLVEQLDRWWKPEPPNR